ncbi:MAG: PIN domain nuclease [Chloroflexi bacterium]|nr:PIN domain nuclease [Chloroflexota bacterium]
MNKVTIILIYAMITIIGLIGGWQLGMFIFEAFSVPLNAYLVYGLCALLIGVIGFLFSLLIAQWLIKLGNTVRLAYRQLNLVDLILGFAGLVIGLLVAYLTSLASNIYAIPIVGPYLPAVLSVILGYIGMTLFLSKREELGTLLFSGGLGKGERGKARHPDRRYLLDTNVIIDGRVVEVLKSGLLEGAVLIPSFVLTELQYVADSADSIKRARGRRGLEVLNRIQKDSPTKIEIIEAKGSGEAVDQRLVKLAKAQDATLVTNDFNLAQIARLQGIRLLNLNELANALKPVVLPGEEIEIAVIKEGKEYDQGVGYLDDGTMVVVEEGRALIGQTTVAVVTSILATSAGRMIFVRPLVK